jgi:hypothetical protein
LIAPAAVSFGMIFALKGISANPLCVGAFPCDTGAVGPKSLEAEP